MADAELINSRFKQSEAVFRSLLSDGGTILAGVVTSKTAWPAKDGREATWNIEVGYQFGTSRIQVSEKFYTTATLGSYQVLRVMQRPSSGGRIYSNALEI